MAINPVQDFDVQDQSSIILPQRSVLGKFTEGEPDVEASDQLENRPPRPAKWSMGVLNDPLTHEVPGK